jgi:ubiquinone/menaquinone biosynthesis C-methylase UbiE
MTYRADQVASSYDRTFREEGMSDSPSFYAWALGKLTPEPGKRLLDVACGEGLLLRQATMRGLVCWGIDLSPAAVEITRRAAPQATLALGSGEQLPYDDASFDYITCLGSLEHYLDPWRGASEIRRVLRPGGRAAILLPNSYYWADILWHVWRKGWGPRHRQLVERFATAQEWRALLEMMGLRVLKTVRYNFCWPRTGDDWRWYARYPRKALYLLTSALSPLNLSYSFLYVCEPGVEQPDRNESLPLVLRRPEGHP